MNVATLRRRWSRLAERALLWRAERHRRRLSDVTFIAITGSTGKTTTRQLIAEILSTAGPCTRTRISNHRGIARTILNTRSTHRFCVAETMTHYPGYLERSMRLVRPRIAVVTNVGVDHRATFGTSDAIAKEKGTVVAALPADGVAVLNADDDRVSAMLSLCACRIVTYGCSSDALVRGEDIRGAWPDRLSLTVRCGPEAVRVQTRLCGVHWAPVVLGSLAAAMAAGIPLAAAAQAIERVEPYAGRMSPVTHPDGVTFIRDDSKASLPTIAPALDFLQAARVPRKIAVLGTLSDYPGTSRRVYVRVAKAARRAADILVFVGPWASRALKAKAHHDDRTVMAFTTVRDAARHLDRILRAGDLILLKGSNRADHLMRIMLARTRSVACWRERCGRRTFCDVCDLLDRPAGPRTDRDRSPEAVLGAGEFTVTEPQEPVSQRGVPVVIGLGNPGPQYVGTPHNVGHVVVDVLADALGAAWERKADAMVAAARPDGRLIRLVKLLRPINATGRVLKGLSRELAFGPADCVLVYDDADLPLGRVRVRMSGSSGGHRGVASVLIEFQTEAFRRVKVGVGRPDGARMSADFLLGPFAEEDRPAIDRASQEAVRKVLELVSSPDRSTPC